MSPDFLENGHSIGCDCNRGSQPNPSSSKAERDFFCLSLMVSSTTWSHLTVPTFHDMASWGHLLFTYWVRKLKSITALDKN